MRFREYPRFLAAIEPQQRAQQPCPAARMSPQGDVLHHAHRLNELHMLKGARDAPGRDAPKVDASQGLAPEPDLAGIEGNDAGQQVERRALAGAIGSDQAQDTA